MIDLGLVKNEQVKPEIVHEKLKNLLGNKLLGVSSHSGGGNLLPEIIFHLDDSVTAQEKSDSQDLLNAIVKPSLSVNGLQCDVSMGLLLSDTYTPSADANDIKYVKFGLQIDNTSGDYELVVFEKTDGEYADIDSGKTYCCDLKEYYIEANGSELLEV